MSSSAEESPPPTPTSVSTNPNAPDVAAQVLHWLSQEGYPFEFEIADVAKSRGLSSRLGTRVVFPPETPREIDVVASIGDQATEHGRHIAITASVVVECKYRGADRPWIGLCQSEPTELRSTQWIAFLDERLRPRILTAIAQQLTTHARCPFLFGLQDVPSCYSVVEGRLSKKDKGDRDVPFDAISKVSEATLHSATRLAATWKAANSTLGKPVFDGLAWIVPCVVIDGPLLTATWDGSCKEVRVAETEVLRVNWTHGQYSVVYVVRRDFFGAFLDRLLPQMRQFVTELKRLASTLSFIQLMDLSS